MIKLCKPMLWRVLCVVLSFLMIVSAVGYTLTTLYEMKINSVLGVSSTKLVDLGDEDRDTEYYKSDYATFDEHYAHAKEVAVKAESEGAVLLRNVDNALPLEKGTRVSHFGGASTNIVYAGTGSGGAGSGFATLKNAFELGGNLSVNDVLWDYYVANGEAPGFEYTEIDPADFTSAVTASYAADHEVAVITIARVGGEGNDLPMSGDSGDYLELSTNERKLVQEVTTKFDKTVVLINSANPIEMGWVEEYEVDAVLWIGTPGEYGLEAVSAILVGDVNPSGRLVDTYAYDSQSSPAAVNNGVYIYDNAEDIMNIVRATPDFTADMWWAMMSSGGNSGSNAPVQSYVVEAEGIYIGYRYYETRYEDAILGQGNADSVKGSVNGAWNYSQEVQWPFGYGFGYSAFTQTLDGVEADRDDITLTVTVRNDGKLAGKDVIQVYGQVPYTDFDKENGIEQSAVTLVGCLKTELIEAGDSKTYTITVDKKEFATYDYKVNKTYILEDGTYYVAIGDNAHDALNNILAAKNATGMVNVDGTKTSGVPQKSYAWTQGELNDRKYSISESTNNGIHNLFDDADLNYYAPNTVTYLSRSDWDKTYPKEYTGISATASMISEITRAYEQTGSSDISSITVGANTEYQLAMMIGADYDAKEWDLILDQLTVVDMVSIIAHLGRATVESIGLNENLDQDGPGGFNINYTDSDISCVAYPGESVIASTFNVEIAAEVGNSIGNDALYAGITGWYGPGANIHRTPYSGLNFEYYSEDPFMSSSMAYAQTVAAQEKGVVVFVKHFFMNDRETNRHGCCTFNNEQAIRQIYLKGFQGAFEAGAKGVMGGFNRIGCTWNNMSQSLMRGLLVDEWGFDGIVTTDFYFGSYMNMRTMLASGTHTACTTFPESMVYQISSLADWANNDLELLTNMRESCRRVLYVLANSNAMNGIDANMRVIRIMPWYRVLLLTVTIILAVLTATAIVFMVLGTFVFNDKSKKAQGENK